MLFDRVIIKKEGMLVLDGRLIDSITSFNKYSNNIEIFRISF